jgi:indole-3-glycerol phosphate synthase
VFVDPRSMSRARDAGADAVALVVRALEDAELGPLVSAARAQGVAVLLECRSAAEVDMAHACRADGVLAALLDRDRLRPDPEGAAAVRARAADLGLPCHDALAPFRDLALSAAPSADPELVADPG